MKNRKLKKIFYIIFGFVILIVAGGLSWNHMKSEENDSQLNNCRKLRDDKSLVYSYLNKYNLEAIKDIFQKCIGENLKNNKELMLYAVNKYGVLLQYANKKLRGDRNIVSAAIENDPSSMQYVSKELLSDREFILSALQANEYLKDHLFNSSSKQKMLDKMSLAQLEALVSTVMFEKGLEEIKELAEKDKKQTQELLKSMNKKCYQSIKKTGSIVTGVETVCY